MLRFVVTAALLSVVSAFVPATGAVCRSSRATATVAVVMKKKKKPVEDETFAVETVPEIPEAAYAPPVDIEEAAKQVISTWEESEESVPPPAATKAPKIDMPDIKAEDFEDAFIGAFKFAKAAFTGVANFMEENEVVDKTKGAFESAVEFNREHEVLLKAQAIASIGMEEMEKASEAAKKSMPKASKEAPEEVKPKGKKGKGKKLGLF